MGRADDVVKVGGKRASWSELNERLRAVPGVNDGFFHGYTDAPGEFRLCAIVAGSASKSAILEALRSQIDPVLLPRRVHKVDAIPRNETGKLVKSARDELLAALGYGT